ncbi:MAG: hypothetical protein HQ579_08110 [Candidatus Omnitrophica bacterium]|nr:hypothetical protein [Candidatus Omnitrophota bacterium]
MDTLCKSCFVELTDYEREENDGLCHFCYAREAVEVEDTLKHPDKVTA